MGDLHFAIHTISNSENESPGVGSVKLVFELFDVDSFVEHLISIDVQPLYPPIDGLPPSPKRAELVMKAF